jgi:hypothetical protein
VLDDVQGGAGLDDLALPPSAVALKTRLCVAQGNRLLNYYLFAGGHNPLLDIPVGDGNERIAFTGERHGFTVPVGPEGQLNPSYPVLAETLAELRAYGDLLADMDEEYDDIALGFVLTGGRLLLTGALPTQTPDGTPCTLLADALGLTPGELVDGTPHYFPSVRAATWTTKVHVGVLQPLTLTDSSTVTHDVFATDTATGSPVGVEVRAGNGHAVVLTCDYPAHLPFWTSLLARLGAIPRHTHDATTPGIVITSTATPTGTRLLHALNVSPVDPVADHLAPRNAGGRSSRSPREIRPNRSARACGIGLPVPSGAPTPSPRLARQYHTVLAGGYSCWRLHFFTASTTPMAQSCHRRA